MSGTAHAIARILPPVALDAQAFDAAEPVAHFDFLGAHDLLTLPAPAWRVDGLLPFGGLAVLYGPPGTGKTFLALSLALAIAAARPWLGRATAWSPVVYVAAEGAHGLGVRLEAWLAREELGLDALEGHFFAIPETVSLLDGLAVEHLLSDVDARLRCHPALVVFDTLARAMPGGDENAARDVGLAIAGADRIRRATDATVLLVHHTQKAGELERGSGALRGAADTMLYLAERDGGLSLEITKQRHAAPGEPVALQLCPLVGSAAIGPAGTVATSHDPTRTERRALEALTAVAVGDAGATATEWRDGSQLPHGTFFRARARLVQLELVRWDRKAKRYHLTGKGIAASVPSPNAVPTWFHERAAVGPTTREALVEPPGGTNGTPTGDPL